MNNLARAICLGVALLAPIAASAAPDVVFREGKGQLAILVDGQLFATYVYVDDTITRPYFCDIHAPGGTKITRNHPPVEGQDLTDHATFHPGLWMAFGDISGADFWRIKARVRHESFAQKPQGDTFTVKNVYEADGKIICREQCRFTLKVKPEGYLLLWESTFTPGDGETVFGDQEEMGLGVRMATALTVQKGNGTIVNSDGLKNEDGVWGKPADWCDYSGEVDGRPVGVSLMPHPANFRRSWFHARDYGLLVANPFGRQAFTKAEPSTVVVPAEGLTLRFGILVHAGPVDLDAAYHEYAAME